MEKNIIKKGWLKNDMPFEESRNVILRSANIEFSYKIKTLSWTHKIHVSHESVFIPMLRITFPVKILFPVLLNLQITCNDAKGFQLCLRNR